MDEQGYARTRLIFFFGLLFFFQAFAPWNGSYSEPLIQGLLGCWAAAPAAAAAACIGCGFG
ncbi:hypothetical protein BD324DRAFT_638431 [Kockovaella imperatae]|uniref:Uncharacterized protein n=1 Tax=Kockovaella imperatae TaxID=4999 RepID=A0A1Y1U6V9_9TREE|nr:hypothetical protein BD324DRAFT_638431 [Kockovaella imperatae]ORX33748.1 hypothetical protein BD324DRAFT_638431 [Kockovaella imperatae]